ncbi:MAG: eCIS core domain-containing protein [Pseudomonadota bacterium]
MPAAPPAADTKKPATPPPAKAPADKGKAAAGGKDQKKAAAPAPAALAPQKPAPDNKAAGASQQRFDRMAVRAKLAVSEPGDAVEREADAIAAKVMRAPAPAAAGDKNRPAAPQAPAKPPAPASGPGAKPPATAPKAPAAPAGNRPIQRQVAPPVSRPSPPAAEGNAPTTSSDLIARLGSGAPLDAEARAFFEQRLGRDLSDVRIHTDENAADAARSLQARAFTWGHHIAFASGEYQPGAERGRELLAHELAHVLQNDSAGLNHVIARKKDDNPRYKDPNDIGKEAFDPAKDKAARPGMETLKLPAIKGRHADLYKKRAGKSLKRPAGYDRKQPPFQTEQVKKWKEKIDLAAHYAGIGFTPGSPPHALTFYGAKQQKISGTEGEVTDRLKVPTWTPDGSWLTSALQVDHIVEVQVGGEDAFENYELLTGAHNVNVGSLLRASIYAGVKGYLAATDKNTGDALVKKYLDENDVEFKKVEAGGEGKNLEKTSQFWSRKEITEGKHLVWLKDEDRPKKDDGTDKTRFALYSYTGAGFIDAYPLNKNKVTVADTGRLAGIKLTSITLQADFDKASGGSIGQIKGTWDLPKSVKASKGKAFESALNAVAGKPYAGAIASLTPPELDVEGASPVSFQQVDFVRGKLSAEGQLKTSHPLFPGIDIPVRWRGDDFAFEYTIPVGSLKLPVPGLTIDDASITLFFGTKGLGADGNLNFTIAGLGSGMLSATIQQGAKGPDFSAKGQFTADRKLFDLATLEVGYSSSKGFSGKGTLGITSPNKVKGIKSAKLTAGYAEGVFSATGEVQPDIPGLKSASLSVSYGNNTLAITGKLGIDERVPGIESADITVDVKKANDAWKVGASGEVKPKLPGLSGANLKFSYDDGLVLVEGEFTIKKGPLDGKVTAGVTNAAVDDKGQRSATGAGKSFKVFGAADIDAVFIKDKLTGKLKLRLLPDGSVRVGGGLAVPDFQVFPQIPEKAEFLRQEIKTPKVPLPGLGFSVGSVSVGLTFYASAFVAARAAIGPGKMTGIEITVDEFDPAKIDFNTLTIRGKAGFSVMADAGLEVGGAVHLNLSAVIVELDGSIGVSAKVGIPADKPVLSAKTSFVYSADKGLDLQGMLDLDISPELKFALTGTVAAKLNVLIDTITVWSKNFTIAEANYKLPIGISAHGELGYNSKTGKFSADPKDAITVNKPDLSKGDALKGVVDGSPAPPSIKTTDKRGKEIDPSQLVCIAPEEPNASFLTDEPNQSVMPQRAPGAAARTPAGVDEGIVERLGTGAPLDLATRGFFEQRLKTNLAEVRVHTSLGAQQEARALSARAFTVGQHIAFAANEYRPDTPEGRELIAHELAHVVQQQQGAARALMRVPDETPAGASAPTPTSTPETPPAAGTVAGATPAGPPTATPAAAGRGPITLPSLKLPELKYGADVLNSHRKTAYDAALAATVERPAGYRRADIDSRQARLWTQATPAATLRNALSTKVPGLEPSRVYVAVPRSRSLGSAGSQVIVGAPNELALALRQPRWDRQGAADEHPFEIDHIVELQIGGPAYDRLSNLELLERSANGASGRAIDAFMDEAFTQYAASSAAAALPEADRTAEVLKRQYRVRYGGFTVQGVPATGKRWTLAEVQAGDPAEGLRIYDPANLTGGAPAEPNAILHPWPAGVDATRFTGSPSVLVVYASARGGEPRQVPLRDGQPANPEEAVANLLPGLRTEQLSLTLGTTGEGPIGRIQGALVHEQLGPDARIPVDIPIARRRGLANAGVLNTDAVVGRLRNLLREGGVTALSPIVVDEVDVRPGIGLYVAGRVEPSIELIRNASLDFEIRGDELRVSKTFYGGDLNLGGPFRIDGSDLTVGLGTRTGLFVEGGVAFSIERLGQGTLRGAGRLGEFSIDGRFDFDRRLFDADANITLGYRRGPDAPNGKLSGSGTVTIGPGKVRGIRRATVQAAFDGEQRSVTGTAELDVPGVESATLGVEFTPEGGTQISGSARFRDRPGLRNGQISATLSEAADGWHMSATGGADAAFAGISARLQASYDDGLFMFAADAPFAVGERVSGNVRVGVTNGQVDDEGRLVEGSAPASGGAGTELRPFGNGTVNVRITDWLQGGVGLKVRPNGQLLVSGRIGIPAPVTVFDAYPSPERARRTLFSMPTVSVPLVGLSVGSTVVGVALTINGRITGYAQIGPGRLTQTEVRVQDFNPAQPDSLHVTGDAEFHLPAEAGVAAGLDAGVSLGAAVISATAGINVSAGASLVAEARPHVNLDWRPSAGLHLHAALDASLTPRLAFDVNGYAEVVANALVTTFTLWRKDWNLAHREVGSNLALRLHAPVDYYSDGRGVVFDPQQVRFEVPSLNADTLAQLMNNEGGEEHVERAGSRA